MKQPFYILVVKVEVEGLGGTKEMEYTMQSTLTIIDKKTLPFACEEEFFFKNKERIRKSIEKKYELETSFPPTDILLKRIYILDKKHEIRALFQKIKYKEKYIALEDIILYKMQKGSIYSFYSCDKKRSSLEEYDSFFKEVDSSLLERIELNCNTCKDIKLIWNSISSSQRIASLIRFLLLDAKELPLEELFTIFCERIPAKENATSALTKESAFTNAIRTPYVEH